MQQLLLLSLVLLTPALAQDEKGKSDFSSSSHSKRVVVVDGETVVDEETRDGKPVPGGKAEANPELERILKELERELGKAKVDAKSSKSSSSHTKRVVVINGETVVDEETKDGKPVKGRKGTDKVEVDLDRLLRDLDRQLAGDKNVKRSSSSSSSSKRVVVVNGETVVDEETRDGKPVRGDRKKPVKVDPELERLRELLEKELAGKGKQLAPPVKTRDVDAELQGLVRKLLEEKAKKSAPEKLRKTDPKDAAGKQRSEEAARALRELEEKLKRKQRSSGGENNSGR